MEEMEQEINLREYLEVIIRKKWIVLVIFSVSVVGTAIFSLQMPRVYQATALIMITPSRQQTAFSPSKISLDAEEASSTPKSHKSTLPISTHKVLLKSNVVLERVIDTLTLVNGPGRIFIPTNLAGKLDVKGIKETNILQLKAIDTDPKKAKEIANTWTQAYTKYSHEFILGDVKGIGDFINDQFDISRQNLIQAEGIVRDFKNKHSIELKQAGLYIKKAKLNNCMKELVDLESDLKTKEISLAALKKAIEKQERFIIVSKAITDDALWQQVSQRKGLRELEKRKLRSEEINPIYENLETHIVDTEVKVDTFKPRIEYLKGSIKSAEKEIKELEKAINQNEFELTQLNRQVEIYERTYTSLATKIEEARIVKAAQLGEVKIISPALEPKSPIGPKRRQHVTIAAILGLMVGTFTAFSTEFLAKYKKQEQSKK